MCTERQKKERDEQEAQAILAWEDRVIKNYVETGEIDPAGAEMIIEWQESVIEDLTQKMLKLAKRVNGPLMPIFHSDAS